MIKRATFFTQVFLLSVALSVAITGCRGNSSSELQGIPPSAAPAPTPAPTSPSSLIQPARAVNALTPLTQADIDTFCAINSEAVKLRKGSFQNFTKEYRKLLESHGMNPLSYAKLSARVTAAMGLIDGKLGVAIDESQKADVEIIRKNLSRIKACMKAA